VRTAGAEPNWSLSYSMEKKDEKYVISYNIDNTKRYLLELSTKKIDPNIYIKLRYDPSRNVIDSMNLSIDKSLHCWRLLIGADLSYKSTGNWLDFLDRLTLKLYLTDISDIFFLWIQRQVNSNSVGCDKKNMTYLTDFSSREFEKLDLYEKFKRIIDEYASGVNSFLLAVSGGIDSITMLDLFYRLKKERQNLQIGVATFNHKLRPEADEEVEFVRAESERMGFTFYTDSADVRSYSRQNKMSIEEAARILDTGFSNRL